MTTEPTRAAPRRTLLAPAILATTSALVVAAGAFAISNGGSPRHSLGTGLPWWFWIQNSISALIYVVPGWYLAKKRPGVAFGWLALAAGLAHALAAAGFEYTVNSVVAGHHHPAAWVGLWLAAWGPVVELPVLASIYALFPDARRPRGLLGLVAVLAGFVVTVGVICGLFDPILVVSPKSGAVAALRNPFAIHLRLVHTLDGAATFAPGMVAATGVLIVRWWRAREEERRVLSWLAAVAILAVVVAAPAASTGGAVGVLAAQLVSLVEVAVITAAVLRQRVFGILVVLNRTLVYVSLTVGIALIYAGVVALVASFASRTSSSVLGAVVAALAVTPAREWIQRGVNRFLYGQRDEPYAVLSAVGERLASATSADELLQGFVDEAARSLRLPYLSLELDQGERFIAGTPGEYESFDVRHEGRLLAHLLAGRRSGEAEVSANERRLLGHLADQASVAVANYSLTIDLRRSRERIVTAREEERRRLRRDLHDGLGPQLTGISLGLDAAADSLNPIAPTQASTLELLRRELGEAIVDIRRLVHDLRPPSLDELGLLGAVRELAERSSRGDLVVVVAGDTELPDLSAAVEVAVLRIVSEAVNNVVRHSGATSCHVVIRSAGGELVVRVEDDGRGLPAEFHAGVGTGSMRERAEEVGGQCTIVNRAPNGVSVEIQLPVGPR